LPTVNQGEISEAAQIFLAGIGLLAVEQFVGPDQVVFGKGLVCDVDFSGIGVATGGVATVAARLASCAASRACCSARLPSNVAACSAFVARTACGVGSSPIHALFSRKTAHDTRKQGKEKIL